MSAAITGTPMRSPDFVKIAEAHGLTGMRVTSAVDVEGAIRTAEETDGTVVIDFRVEPEDSVYPMVPSGAALDAMIRRPQSECRKWNLIETYRTGEALMQHTLIALVEDKPGVLNRVASLFRRRAFNIDSLTVGHTDRTGYLAHDHRDGQRHRLAQSGLPRTCINWSMLFRSKMSPAGQPSAATWL